MILASNIMLNNDIVLKAIKKGIKSKFIVYKNNYKYLIDLYGESQIYEAIDSIYSYKNKIIAPVSGIYGVILRFLEYGGNNVKQLKLLSSTSRVLTRKVSENNVL